jgi:hypothetical protein
MIRAALHDPLTAGSGPSVDRLPKLSPGDADRGEPADQAFKARIPLAAFDTADVVPVQFGGESKLFLGQIALLSEAS